MIKTPDDYLNQPIDKQTFSDGVTKLISRLNFTKSLDDCFKFFVDNVQVGLIVPQLAHHLLNYPDVFTFKDKQCLLNPNLKTFKERTDSVEKVLIELKTKNVLKALNGWRKEHYFVRKSFNTEPLMSLERAAAHIFGIKAYGCHINGYIKKDGQYFIWIARRSKTKQTYPYMLDNFVAGGLTAGLGVVECAKKELEEEAGLPIELCSKLKSVDAISYCFENEMGIHMEGEFIFDLKLPNSFLPKNQDGEVDSFYLMNIDQVKNAILSDEFKLNSAIVTLNFLMRKSLVSPDDLSNYYEILENIHKPGL